MSPTGSAKNPDSQKLFQRKLGFFIESKGLIHFEMFLKKKMYWSRWTCFLKVSSTNLGSILLCF